VFQARKKELLDSAVACVQYVLVALAQQLVSDRDGDWLKSQLPSEARRKEVIRFISPIAVRTESRGDIANALFPRSRVHEFDSSCGSHAKVVAQNVGKGSSYNICAQAKALREGDTAHTLNDVETMVGVMLHEVAHSIHTEFEFGVTHGAGFEELNSFLVQFAKCAVLRAREGDRAQWRGVRSDWQEAVQEGGRRPFDVQKFAAQCASSARVRFCGVQVPMGSCTACKKKGD
jgi:hypothetical protein